MKNNILLFLFFSILIISCEKVDYGNINQDPTQFSEGNIDGLFRAGVINAFSVVGEKYLTNATLYCQYQTQNLYTTEQRYSNVNGEWERLTVNALANLKEVAKTDADPRGDTANLNAMAEIISVLIWKKLTDTYGPIPYSEALQGAQNLTPKYDDQKFIYTDLIKRAKDARDLIGTESSLTINGDNDILYSGDLAKWQKLANSLIMTIALQMSNKEGQPSGIAATAFNEALTHGPIVSNLENLVFRHDVPNNITNAYSFSLDNNLTLSKEFTDALKGEGDLNPTSNTTYDNRIYVMSDGANDDNGLPYGYASYYDSYAAQMSSIITSPESDLVILNAAQVYLMRAEAAALGWTSEDAEAMLTAGITASFEQWDEILDDYDVARVNDATNTSLLQVIGEEFWKASFPDGHMGWSNQRRTGYPMLTPAVDALNGGVIPTRTKYPAREAVQNATNVNNALTLLSISADNNTAKPWFMN